MNLVGFRPVRLLPDRRQDEVSHDPVRLLVHAAGAVVRAGDDHDHIEVKGNGEFVFAVRTSRRTITPPMVTKGARAATGIASCS